MTKGIFTQQKRLSILSLLLLGLSLAVLFAVFLINGLFVEGSKFTVAELRTSWDIPIDATDITIASEKGYTAYIKLSFKASGTWLADFYKHFCDGILHQGYDPYHAVNVFSHIKGQRLYLIKHEAGGYTYYSYSPDTPDTVWGNRCQPSSAPIQIRVSELKPDLYEVKVDNGWHLLGENTQYCKLVPCSEDRRLADTYVLPIHDLPLVIRGLEETSPEHYILVTDEFCIDSLYDSRSIFEPTPYFQDSIIHLTFDHQPYDVPAVLNRYNHLTTEAIRGHSGFYCVKRNWIPGVHTMQIDVSKPSAQKETYSWNFYVE